MIDKVTSVAIFETHETDWENEYDNTIVFVIDSVDWMTKLVKVDRVYQQLLLYALFCIYCC